MRQAMRGIIVLLIVLASGCSSSVVINSDPPGAKVYVDGALIGRTPVTYSDSAVVGTEHTLRLEKEGYKPLTTTFSRDREVNLGAAIGGCCLTPILWLWLLDYPPYLMYELKPLPPGQQEETLPVR